jgi:hypothetical protein
MTVFDFAEENARAKKGAREANKRIRIRKLGLPVLPVRSLVVKNLWDGLTIVSLSIKSLALQLSPELQTTLLRRV